MSTATQECKYLVAKKLKSVCERFKPCANRLNAKICPPNWTLKIAYSIRWLFALKNRLYYSPLSQQKGFPARRAVASTIAGKGKLLLLYS